MNYIGANVGAILTATTAGLVVGALYTALIRHLRGRSAGMSRHPGSAFLVVACLAEFWLAAILAGALILAPAPAGAWTMAIGSAVVIWVGFVLPTLVVSSSFRSLPVTAIVWDCAHWLAVMVIQAVVLHLVGLTRP